jgi:HEAT repeat protein
VFAWGPFPGRAAPSLRAALLVLGALQDGKGSIEELETKLHSPDKWARAAAVEALALCRTPRAWKLVLEGLSDPKGEVADTAQLLFAAVDDPKTCELLGKQPGLDAKEALVRARAAELLGRLALDPSPKWLVDALDDDDAEVRRMGAWSIERLASANRLDEKARRVLDGPLVSRARSERDPLARARALLALAAFDVDAARPAVEDALRARDPLVRSAAVSLAERVLEPARILAPLQMLAGDEALPVRTAAVDALGDLGTRSAVGVLVGRLAEETEERLILRCVARLQDLSGLKHRRDPRPWNDWFRSLPPDWTGAGLVHPETADEPGGGTAALAGLSVLSRRVAILIDLSGSIWNERPDGRTRKDVVDQKLREALEALPPETRFNLVPYTEKPHPWQEKLVTAAPSRVRAAAAWFEDLHESGSGNLWDAMLLSLDDPEVDTLMVLFDGAPTGGTRHRLELFVPLFLERNAARRVVVDLILVDASRRLESFWRGLAEGTGGRLTSVTL